jgi:predicted flap endonuclease-1-like 5' DNA nuclease
MIRRLIVFLFGMVFGFVLGELAAPARPRAAQSAPAGQQPADPLIEINGIGSAFEQALAAIGISTFAQLAQQDADALAARMPVRVTAERIRRERWIEQAQARLAG